MRKITRRGPGPGGEKVNSVYEFDIYMVMINRQLNIWVKEVRAEVMNLGIIVCQWFNFVLRRCLEKIEQRQLRD